MTYDCLVVGAGFAGSVVAERLSAAGRRVLLIDRRGHIAGNAYDRYDTHGVLIHQYGPHIFHTNVERVWKYLSGFTEWRPYEHRVLSSINGALYPIPVNLTTINKLYGLTLDVEGMRQFIEVRRKPQQTINTSEDFLLDTVGPELCDLFFRGYTRKQWNRDLSELSARVAARVPVRFDVDDRYFTDAYQAMPAQGYTEMFRRMLASPLIDVQLGVALSEIPAWQSRFDDVVYTGPIDEFFDFRYGPLAYRSLRFEHEHFACRDMFQPVGTVNYPNEFDYTRITEFKHLTGQASAGTSIVREFAQDDGEPYYPVPNEEAESLYDRYRELHVEVPHVRFIGRLAQYRYYNMDQVAAVALNTAQSMVG